MIKLRKISIISIFLLLSISTQVHTNETPSINIKGYIGQPGIDSNGPGQLDYNSLIFYFDRLLGKTKNEIIHQPKVDEGPPIRIKENSINNKNTLLILKNDSYDRMTRGIYILDKNNISIGYCILQQQGLVGVENEPEISQIKSLPVNLNYLKDDLMLPAGTTIKFHEKDHGDYIERYAIVKDSKMEYITMDGFYPKSLENKLKKRIVTVINDNNKQIVTDPDEDQSEIQINDTDD